jgi:hypothetical protein
MSLDRLHNRPEVLAARIDALEEALSNLIEWDARMGYFDNPVWDEARKVLDADGSAAAIDALTDCTTFNPDGGYAADPTDEEAHP